MKKKNSKKWTLVLVLLLVVSIGYAALASNLKINGTSGVKSATWDVYWNNVQVTQGSVATTQGNQARITDQKKTQVEYSVTLNEPGDFYEFTVDAVNNGTIDAMIAANGIVNGVYSDSNYTQTATLPKTVSYTVTYADGTTIEPKHLLAKKNGNTPTIETYKVRIEYKNDDSINPGDLDNNNDHTYYFKFSVNYVQADSTKVARNSGSNNLIPTCPNCVFAKNFDSQYLFDELTIQTTNTIDSYSDIFLGYVQEYDEYSEKNIITKGLACAKIDNTVICVKGWNDEDYLENKRVLDSANFDTCNYTSGMYECSKGTLSFTISDYVADVYVSNGNERCWVDRDGYATCSIN